MGPCTTRKVDATFYTTPFLPDLTPHKSWIFQTRFKLVAARLARCGATSGSSCQRWVNFLHFSGFSCLSWNLTTTKIFHQICHLLTFAGSRYCHIQQKGKSKTKLTYLSVHLLEIIMQEKPIFPKFWSLKYFLVKIPNIQMLTGGLYSKPELRPQQAYRFQIIHPKVKVSLLLFILRCDSISLLLLKSQ